MSRTHFSLYPLPCAGMWRRRIDMMVASRKRHVKSDYKGISCRKQTKRMFGLTIVTSTDHIDSPVGAGLSLVVSFWTSGCNISFLSEYQQSARDHHLSSRKPRAKRLPSGREYLLRLERCIHSDRFAFIALSALEVLYASFRRTVSVQTATQEANRSTCQGFIPQSALW